MRVAIYGAEMSTPLLNSTWLMTKLKVTKSHYILFNVLGYMLLAFFVFRNVVGIDVLYHMLTNPDLWVGFMEFYYFFVVTTVMFAGLNAVWLYKFLVMAFGGKE